MSIQGFRVCRVVVWSCRVEGLRVFGEVVWSAGGERL